MLIYANKQDLISALPAEEIEERSLKPHMDVATWDELYQGWQNNNLKYYWRKRALHLCPPSPVNVRERPC
jgi:hypothetical protein